MDKIRILVIDANPMTFDGITATILNYSEKLDKEQFDIDFVSINEVDSTIVSRIHQMGARLYTIKGRNKTPISYINKVAMLIKANKYHLVHTHGSSCTLVVEMIAARIAGVPCCPHSHSTNCEHKIANRILRPVFNLLYRNGFACSQEAGEWLYRRKKYYVVNNGIDTEKYAFNPKDRLLVRGRLGIKDFETAIVQIGFFSEVKNHKFSLSMLKALNKREKKYRIIFAGDGGLFNQIKEEAKKQGVYEECVFLGAIDFIPQLLSACDVMVLPSLYEGFPFVALESQANGIKCYISSKVTRNVKFCEDVEFLDLNNDIWTDEISNAEKYDQSKRILASNRAISTIIDKGYDINNNTKRLEKLYRDLAKKI